jgi:2-keto-4-pentenoate hydratase
MRRSNKPLFTLKETMDAVDKFFPFIEIMDKCNNVKEWNDARDIINFRFEGTIDERLALFGYIDGVHHPRMFGKTCGEIPDCRGSAFR